MEKHTKLLNYVTAHNRTKFVWGTNDCFTFTFGWIKEEIGKDLWKVPKESSYKNREEAYALLEKFGGREVAESYLGDPIPVCYAVAGDIVCGDLGEGETLGICLGIDSVFLGLKDIVTKRTLELDKAWRI